MENLATLLQLALEEMVRAVDTALREAGYGDIKPSHGPVFDHIDPGGTRLSTLAARAGMSKQLMHYLVDPLVSAGYFERRVDPSDGRSKLIVLTSKGRRAVATAEAAIAATERSWGDRFGEKRLSAVRAALEQIAAANRQ